MARKRTRQELDEFAFEESYNKTQLLKVKPFKAKTESQAEAYRILKENTLTFLAVLPELVKQLQHVILH